MSSDFAVFGMDTKASLLAPGALVLVVGPSGAGKDTLIEGARAILHSDPRFFFPRRAVTRRTDSSEDHCPMTPHEFNDAVNRGKFLFSWSAHGLCYGISSDVADHLRDAEVVVCNVSRTIIDDARHRCATTRVVLVTASNELRAMRLWGRGRELTIDDRLDRTVEDFDAGKVDFTVENSTTICAAVARFVDYLRQVAQLILPKP